MTTPYDIITRAMKDIGALAAGENKVIFNLPD
jgi:hypothetical protein